MLSGNGRHRRPRQAPALLVAAGVTGSAIAIPLLGATGASAASGTTWDAVADCESGGSWSADSGNGYYGGLQMTQETWEEYGGLDYAPSADQASRSQQIAVAEKVLAGKGTSAWATCSLIAGLSQDSDAADVDTGVLEDSASPSADSGTTSGETGDNGTKSADSAESGKSGSSAGDDATSAPDSDTSGGSQSSDSSSTGDATETTGATKSNDSDKSAQNGDASTGTGAGADSGADDGATSGRHRGGSADEDATGSRTDDSSGRHASRGDSASRDAADGSYTVRAGDSLWEIADSLGVNGGWREIYAANKATVGADPDLIVPGQSLELDSE